ncbi:MAG: hypothetical protein RR653_00540 [Clostridia bacterium]
MNKPTPILVLVTLQRACARLIRKGADMAMSKGCPLLVLHIASKVQKSAGEPGIDAQTLDYLYALSSEAGAEMCVLTSDVPVTAIANYAQENGVKQVVLGDGERACGIAETLSRLLPGVQVLIVREVDLTA